MLGILSRFYYKRKLRALLEARDLKHDFVNLDKVKRMVIAFQCETYAEMRDIEKAITPTLNRIKGCTYVVFLNMDKVENFTTFSNSDVLLFKKDLVRKLTPSPDMIEIVDNLKADVWVNLDEEKSSVIDFLTQISQAKMRVGFETKKDFLDLMITVPENKGLDFFLSKMIKLLGSINKTKVA